jgi:eukaryotic-like serine/threonine-protein kinase
MADSQSLLGQTVSHYHILEKLGSGGMGEVYRAHDEQLGRDVALKVLAAGVLADQAARKQFHKEALALAKLSHPNVAMVFEFGSQNGLDFLAMELIAGDSLSEKLKQGPLPVPEVQRLGIQLANGLASAHDQGVVHRDLKPGNVFLTRDGNLKILDFGLAKFIQPQWSGDVTQSTEAESTAISGTVPYMSPEQLRGLPVDTRSDIYAAGAVLYEMATGRRPFPQSQSTELIDAILHQTPPLPKSVNPDVSPGLQALICRALEKEPQRRYQSARQLHTALEGAETTAAAPVAKHSGWLSVAGAVLAVIGLAFAGWHYLAHKTRALNATDTVVLADFANTTGEPVFDDALKQAVSVQLAQSPFLNILPGQKVREQLRFMGRSPGDRVTQEVAQEVCQRTRSKAVLAGSIAKLGSQYVVGLNAINCQTGEAFVQAQGQAVRKEDVLKTLGGEATKLREKLGESLSSIRRFDVPVQNATTSSLEALRDVSLGVKISSEKGDAESIPFYQHAIELDPKFALAYALLGSSYNGLGETNQANENYTRAYELRERVSEQEKFEISVFYYSTVTGELEKADQTLDLWAQTYPREPGPHFFLSNNYAFLGAHEKALAENLEGIRLDTASGLEYGNLMLSYDNLNRFAEAKAVYQQVLARHLDAPFFHIQRYCIAFLEGDAPEMNRQFAWGAGKSGEDSLVSAESDTEAFFGHLAKARQLSERAAAIAQRSGDKETAAGWLMNDALREVEFGNPAQARQKTASALALASSQDLQTQAALTSARTGDSVRALKITEGLAKQFPLNTLLNRYWIPTLRAAVEINHDNPAGAIETLKDVAPYELGEPPPLAGSLYPVYIRGQAYLLLLRGNEAAVEFQKFIDHRGVVVSFPLGAVARLGLARAYASQAGFNFVPHTLPLRLSQAEPRDNAAAVTAGNASADALAKARAAYQDFLALWKDADPDIPILKQAKAEYAKLQ